MNLLMFNLAVDDKHVTLAFSLRWIEALAARFKHIDVVTMTAGHHQLPSNVTVWSVGRERGYPEWLRALRFYWLVWRAMRQRHIDVVFTHMIPVFAVMFWPVARLTGLKNVLWYAHGATPRMLKLAHWLVDRVVSSTPQGFRLPSDKVSFIGQGIDAGRYQTASRISDSNPQFHILTVGRLAPSKGLDLLVSTLAGWRPATDWHLTIVGDGTSGSEHRYAQGLRHKTQEALGPSRITFTGRLDPVAIVPLLGKADVFINLSSTGSLDKAMVEAMACGCPVVSSNDAFRAIAVAEGFPECAIEHSSQSLCVMLDRLFGMSACERQALGARQAEIARRDHTLNGLIQRLHDILAANARVRG